MINKSEKNARKILFYLEKTKGSFFRNNVTTRKKLGMNFAEINSGTRLLVKQGILIRYVAGCYEIHREKIKK